MGEYTDYKNIVFGYLEEDWIWKHFIALYIYDHKIEIYQYDSGKTRYHNLTIQKIKRIFKPIIKNIEIMNLLIDFIETFLKFTKTDHRTRKLIFKDNSFDITIHFKDSFMTLSCDIYEDKIELKFNETSLKTKELEHVFYIYIENHTNIINISNRTPYYYVAKKNKRNFILNNMEIKNIQSIIINIKEKNDQNNNLVKEFKISKKNEHNTLEALNKLYDIYKKNSIIKFYSSYIKKEEENDNDNYNDHCNNNEKNKKQDYILFSYIEDRNIKDIKFIIDGKDTIKGDIYKYTFTKISNKNEYEIEKRNINEGIQEIETTQEIKNLIADFINEYINIAKNHIKSTINAEAHSTYKSYYISICTNKGLIDFTIHIAKFVIEGTTIFISYYEYSFDIKHDDKKFYINIELEKEKKGKINQYSSYEKTATFIKEILI